MIKYLLILYFVLTALIGEYVPQRDENGVLLAKQCWGSTGTCWCQYTKEKKHFRITEARDCPNGPI